MLGGPIAHYLLKKHSVAVPGTAADDGNPALPGAREPQPKIYNVLRTLAVLAMCVSLGDAVNRFLFDQGMLLPGFLTSMLVAIVITNLTDAVRRPLNKTVVGGFGEVSLNIFLSMSMMSIQLWVLAEGITLILVVLFAQVVVMTLFAT